MEVKHESHPKLIPQKIAQRCPVCNGFGTLKYGTKICQACTVKDTFSYLLFRMKEETMITNNGLGTEAPDEKHFREHSLEFERTMKPYGSVEEVEIEKTPKPDSEIYSKGLESN